MYQLQLYCISVPVPILAAIFSISSLPKSINDPARVLSTDWIKLLSQRSNVYIFFYQRNKQGYSGRLLFSWDKDDAGTLFSKRLPCNLLRGLSLDKMLVTSGNVCWDLLREKSSTGVTVLFKYLWAASEVMPQIWWLHRLSLSRACVN